MFAGLSPVSAAYIHVESETFALASQLDVPGTDGRVVDAVAVLAAEACAAATHPEPLPVPSPSGRSGAARPS